MCIMSINKKNNTISLLRVIATFEIVLCHFLPNLLRGYNVPQFWATYPGIFWVTELFFSLLFQDFYTEQRR